MAVRMAGMHITINSRYLYCNAVGGKGDRIDLGYITINRPR